MAFFSDLWDGIKTVGTGIINIGNTIVDALIDGIFWLVDKIFDAIEAVLNLVEWTFKKIGNWLSPQTQKGDVIFVPPTPTITNHLKELEKNGKVAIGTAVKIGERKVAMQALVADNEVKGLTIAGSAKGFAKEIDSTLQSGKLYKIPMEK